MKKAIKAVILALVIAVMPLSAYASTTFFSNNKLGYHRVGTGSLSGQSFSAELTVTVLPGTPAQPDEAYDSNIGVLLYNTTNYLYPCEYHSFNGHLTCLAAGTADHDGIRSSYSTFTFENSEIGGYFLYN